MKQKLLLGVLGLVAIVLCAASAYLGQRIPFADQWPLFEALRTTASIIFAVVGAWLAIIYPERLKLSFGQPGASVEGTPNIGLLLYPAGCSTIILTCVLLTGIIAPIIKQIPGSLEYTSYLRGFSFFFLTALTLWQVVVVILTLYPADLVQTFTEIERTRGEFQNRRSRLTQRSNDEH